MTLVIPAAAVRGIEDHARATYPEECCGFLLGSFADPKLVIEARRARNVAEADRERRYVPDPKELLAVNRLRAADGRELIGFYHSHPDHPANPSLTDQAEATWPGYSYLIVSIVRGNPNDLRSWVLEKVGGSFRPEILSITA